MRAVVAIAAAVAVSLLLLACSSGDSGGRADSSASPSTTGSIQGSPSPAAEPDAFLVYREASGNLVARNLAADEAYTYVVDFNSEVIVDAQCAADGSRMAFARQPFSRRERLLDIHGDGAPADPIPLPSTTQAFAWSPDGTRIALVHYDGMAQTHRIVVLNVATGEEEELTTGPDFAGSPTF